MLQQAHLQTPLMSRTLAERSGSRTPAVCTCM